MAQERNDRWSRHRDWRRVPDCRRRVGEGLCRDVPGRRVLPWQRPRSSELRRYGAGTRRSRPGRKRHTSACPRPRRGLSGQGAKFSRNARDAQSARLRRKWRRGAVGAESTRVRDRFRRRADAARDVRSREARRRSFSCCRGWVPISDPARVSGHRVAGVLRVPGTGSDGKASVGFPAIETAKLFVQIARERDRRRGAVRRRGAHRDGRDADECPRLGERPARLLHAAECARPRSRADRPRRRAQRHRRRSADDRGCEPQDRDRHAGCYSRDL